MKFVRINSRRLIGGWCLATLVLSAGCDQEWGPDGIPSAEVSGRIHCTGDPLTRGWLEFIPVDGTIGRLKSVSIRPDGTFLAEGVAPGVVAIRVVAADLPGPEYSLFGQIYLIRREIRDAQANQIDIDLEQERRRVTSGQSD
ncbi:hypothetical protein [Tautonia rosea]|uniref:hypothetical protein n=1 Tax=Tautonia rosea TaxID=2728037 RepID=UPI0014764652|nr:hypothetical protein [Tautonia rosea]